MGKMNRMYKRYHDKNHLITDVNELHLSSTAEVLIYRGDQWCCEVMFDLEGKKEKFAEWKPWIIFAAENLSEMDYIAQKYDCSLHVGEIFADGYVVACVCYYEPDLFRLTYYGTCENTEFDVVFQYADDGFILKSFGMVKDIDPDWDR